MSGDGAEATNDGKPRGKRGFFRHRRLGWLGRTGAVAAAVVLLASLAFAIAFPNITEVLFAGDSRQLRRERIGAPQGLTAARSKLLIIAFDGVGRELLYGLLRRGELPELTALLGGMEGPSFPHAYFEESALTVLPSATMPAWASIFTAATPAVNGVPGDEFFVRASMTFAAPVPISVAAPKPLAAVYVDDSVGELLTAPTIYERLRDEEPGVRIWVSTSQVYRGADRLLLGSRSVIGSGFAESIVGTDTARPVIDELTEEIIETVVDELEGATAPEILTVYLPFPDLVAHHAAEGPDRAIENHLRTVVDPLLGRLRGELERQGAVRDRFVVVLSDHGHTPLLKDDAHALTARAEAGPARVLESAGFRVRPFTWKSAAEDFQAVLAYEGAMAFIYLADRSTCATAGARCDWTRPPRAHEDVMQVADAFHAASAGGSAAPTMRGALDLVLIRTASGFDVALGEGRRVPLPEHLASQPRPEDVALVERLSGLASGPHGDRVGDIVIIARGGDDEPIANRYYFASPQHSGHGGPSLRDSAIPVIVARHDMTEADLERLSQSLLGPAPRPDDIGALLLGLRRALR